LRRVRIAELVLPFNDAAVRLLGSFLLERDVELLAHKFRFIVRTTAQHIGEMFDAVLAGVGGFAGCNPIWNVADKGDVFAPRSLRDCKVSFAT
jgi:hypothetical protein